MFIGQSAIGAVIDGGGNVYTLVKGLDDTPTPDHLVYYLSKSDSSGANLWKIGITFGAAPTDQTVPFQLLLDEVNNDLYIIIGMGVIVRSTTDGSLKRSRLWDTITANTRIGTGLILGDNLYLAGHSPDSGYAFIFRVNKTTFVKDLEKTITLTDPFVHSLLPSPDNTVVLFMTHSVPDPSQNLRIIKFAATNLNVEWSTMYKPENNSSAYISGTAVNGINSIIYVNLDDGRIASFGSDGIHTQTRRPVNFNDGTPITGFGPMVYSPTYNRRVAIGYMNDSAYYTGSGTTPTNKFKLVMATLDSATQFTTVMAIGNATLDLDLSATIVFNPKPGTARGGHIVIVSNEGGGENNFIFNVPEDINIGGTHGIFNFIDVTTNIDSLLADPLSVTQPVITTTNTNVITGTGTPTQTALTFTSTEATTPIV